MNKIKYLAAVLIGIAGLGLQQAKADFVSSLNVPNSDLSAFPAGSYGTVNVHLVSSGDAIITFTAASGFGFVDGGAAAVQINAGSFTATILTDADFKQFDSGQVDGFGSFNLVVDNNSSSNPQFTISFEVTAASGTWASAADVLGVSAGGNGGFDAAAHILPLNNNPNGLTGFAGELPGPSVPDGGTTVMLLGAALGALGMVRRYLKS